MSGPSPFGVWLIEAINRLVPPPRNLQECDAAKLGLADYQDWEYNEARKITPEFGRRWDLRGKAVLDVGCGLGGKPIFYAEAGAGSLAALDLRFHSLEATRDLARQHGCNQIQPMLADAAQMPFPSNHFDVIVSVNVFEHIDELASTLKECKRVLRPGGLIFLHFPPFYSPWGAHLEGWINFPWPHVFFSDRTLLAAAARIEERQNKNADYIRTAQFPWAELERLPELNRTTAAQFFRLLKQVDLQILEARMEPFGRHFLLHYGLPGRIALALLRGLGSLPLLREVITTKMVFVLTKQETQ